VIAFLYRYVSKLAPSSSERYGDIASHVVRREFWAPMLVQGVAQCTGMWFTDKNDGNLSVITRNRMNPVFSWKNNYGRDYDIQVRKKGGEG
jgi:hypothetical protein